MTVLDAGCLVFDVETTAADPEQARIVQACTGIASVVDGQGQWHAEVELIDPGVPIPPETTEIHGITDAMVAGQFPEGRYAELVWGSIKATWAKGWPLVIFNAPYDLTVLDRALRRAGLEGVDHVGPVIDPLVIDKACDKYRKGKRTLTVMAEQYGVDIPEGAAHTADGDCYTTVRVARKQLSALVRPSLQGDGFPDAIPRRLVDCTLEDLQALQRHWHTEQKLSFFAYKDRRGEGDEITDRSTAWPIRPFGGPRG